MEVLIGFTIFGTLIGWIISSAMSSENSQTYKINEQDIDPSEPYADQSIKFLKKIQEADTNKLKDLENERLEKEAEKERVIESIRQERKSEKERIKQEKKRYKESAPRVSLNPIKWGKYTLIISAAEKKFLDIYNFETPQEYKKINLITSLANTVLFEEVRLKRLSPNEFEELLIGLDGNTEFYKLIKPNGNTFFDFEAYKTMYSMYIDYRAREFRPIVSMMAVFSSIDGEPFEKEEIEKLAREYENSPMFGRNI